MGSKRMYTTLPDDDKIWLERYSKAYNISVAEAIRQGVSKLKQTMANDTYHTLVQSTRGVWEKGDGLKYQRKIRSEWNSI